MSFSQPHRYKLMIPSYWSDGHDDHRCDFMMSSIPSREDIIAALRKADELEGYSAEYIDGLIIERPDGWYYKTILIYSYTSDKPLWKMVPAP